MTFFEQLYLIMTVGGFVAFTVSLAGVTLVEHRQRNPKPAHDRGARWSHAS